MVVKSKSVSVNRVFANGHAGPPIPDQFSVQKGVPIPPHHRRGVSKYPFDKLNVGDSFFVAGKTVGVLAQVRQAASVQTGHEYVSRTVTENGVKGVRIWRVK